MLFVGTLISEVKPSKELCDGKPEALHQKFIMAPPVMKYSEVNKQKQNHNLIIDQAKGWVGGNKNSKDTMAGPASDQQAVVQPIIQ